MNCNNCGNQLNNDNNFCPKCGASIATNINNTQQSSAIEESTPQTPNLSPTTQQTPMANNIQPQVVNNGISNNYHQPTDTFQPVNNYMNQSQQFNNFSQPINNNSNKSNSIGLIYIIAGIAALFIIFSTISGHANKENTKSLDSNTTPISSTDDYSINFKNYSLNIPENYVARVISDQLIIEEKNGKYAVGISIEKGKYSMVKEKKNELVKIFNSRGFQTNGAVITNYGGLEYITMECLDKKNSKYLAAVTKLDATAIAGLVIHSEDNTYNYKSLEEITPIILSAKYDVKSGGISIGPIIRKAITDD